MTWNTNTLQAEILEQFADPAWCDINDRARSYGLFVEHETSNFRLVTRTADEYLAERLRELVHTRVAWTAQELATELGRRDAGAAGSVGLALPKIPGLLRRSGAWTGRARARAVWVSVPALLRLVQAQEYVTLEPLRQRTGLYVNVLATALKSVGWAMRRVGKERRWYAPSPSASAPEVLRAHNAQACE